jgi:uncharacterized protein (TIGR02171 family)
MIMISQHKGIIVFFAAMALTCAPLSPDRNRPGDFSHPGMKKILSAGKSFQQGWNNTLASYDEKPGMQSGFTYDYWLDTTEVTQKQYYEVTGKRPVSDSSQYGVGDNYPVYYVSWFDAVLYCNARSRAEHLDTVYVYSGIHPPSGGSVYELTGLRYDLSRDGYRLPTEAEWEFAARGGTSALPFSAVSDSSYAWFTSNSSGRTHWVGTRFPNSLGFYDMAGNVFEWTNDWKCMYDGKSISNSLGALQPGNEYEKVIKGGSYNYPQMYLRPSHRSATYATELSTACEYVGFRCARGSIPKGQYIGIGQSTSTNPVNIRISANDLLQFIGTTEAKIVFVNVTGNNRTLCYVDFSRTFPAPWEFLDDRQVYLPTISPDGGYVAYCSRDVGLSGPSKITIRSLDSLGSPRVTLMADSAYAPRWWVNPATGDTCIVYTNSSCDDLSSTWSSTQTFSQKVSGGIPDVSGPKVLIPDGSYHGGISVDGHYAVTGFTGLIMKDLVANSGGRQLFLSPQNGKDGSGSTQVCNVSISPDTVGGVRCLFLDFGCQNQISTVTHSSYGQHEFVFESTMADSVVNYMHCPSGEQAWDNPKWSNQPEFAVGCGRNSANQSDAIYAIDLNKKSCKQIVTGTELQQPYLLTGYPIFFHQDSIGRYNDPLGSIGWNQTILAVKLLMFWRLFDSVEVAAVGSCIINWGINPSMITGLKTFNFGAPGCDPLGQKIIILNYILKHCSNIKLICSSLDLGWLCFAGGDVTWTKCVGQSKGYLYDSCHTFWSDGVSSDFRNVICQVPLPDPTQALNMGFVGLPSQGWGTDPPPFNGGLLSWTIDNPSCQQNLAAMRMIADSLRARKIHWINVNFPSSPSYKNTKAYTFWGPSRQTAQDILQALREIESTNDYFHLYDANNDGNHDYNSSDAADSYHLSAQGAAKLTSRLNDTIHAIFGR